MGADQYVDLAFGQIGEYLFYLFGRTRPRYVVYPDWKLFKTTFECVVVLVGEYRCRYEYSGLFAVGCGLESGADGYFGLAEAYVAAYQPVRGLSMSALTAWVAVSWSGVSS